MTIINNFEDLILHLSQRGFRKRVAVVWAEDESTQKAVTMALEKGFVEATFVGCVEQVKQLAELQPYQDHISYVDVASRDEAALTAVSLAREGKVDVLMKGLINTDNLLHAVLNKEMGILERGNVLTHVTTAQIPGLDRLLFFTDAAVIPYPTHEQRIQQVRYIVNLCHSFGIEEPRVALVNCSEKVNEKFFPFTVGYKDIIEMAKNGDFGRCIVDGPLDVKTALDLHSLQTKGIDSPLQGRSNVLIFPDIQAGNAFYKTLTLFAGAQTAGILQGPKAQVVIPSRSDSPSCKFYSLAVASI